MTDDHALSGALRASCPDLRLLCEEPLARHTSFRIGGAAQCFAQPRSADELAALLSACRALGVTPRVLGAGTNVLAPDEGVGGVVICTKDALTGLSHTENTVRAMAGQTLAQAAVYARDLGLSGLEFAHGIPGTVGGGVYMNAGAYGGEIAQVCRRVGVMMPNGETAEFSGEELKFGYRTSVFETLDCIILWAEFTLTPAEPDAIRARMQELMQKRRASQPLDLPSAGSAFKRPKTGYAAQMIDETGLRGYRRGGAAVSEKHAGFVVNLGGATAQDVRDVLRDVQTAVQARTGMRLEPEIRIW